MEKLKINQWAKEDRPREKMMLRGASALTNAELLAILIGSGSTEETAVEDLCRYKGIGPAKAVAILAASELGKRRSEEAPAERRQIRSSEDIYAWFHPLMCDLHVEECWVMLLNQASKVIDARNVSRGGLASTQVDVRCILREALLKRATAFVLCHNHPSGNVRPSADDDRLTQAVSQAAKTMNIRLLDHVIVTDGSYYSYTDEGRL